MYGAGYNKNCKSVIHYNKNQQISVNIKENNKER